MTDLEALHVALQHMAAVEDQNAVNGMIAETVQLAAFQTVPDLALRQAVQELRAAVPKTGQTLSLEILAAVGRLEGWDNRGE